MLESIESLTRSTVPRTKNRFHGRKSSAPEKFHITSGSMAGATLHHARTVCRRAERLAVVCSNQEKINDIVLQYLNRLRTFCLYLRAMRTTKADV